MSVTVNPERVLGKRNKMIYGHFIEHFHRQIYGGVYDPGNPLSDGEGLRTDVLEAMRKIKVPILRWPGGCFVSSYNWKKAVGEKRVPAFDKAWRVEDPNTFGTDEYVALCRKIGCEPYICTNAGTGTAEEMSDWVEYCNLENEGEYARQRIVNGYPEPHGVRYWSIGNENYGDWEIGAKPSGEWGRLVREAAKMIKHVDPTVELSAAALADVDWNIELLKNCASRLDWISLHQYWNLMAENNDFATYGETMAYTAHLSDSIDRVRGLLTALGLEKQIKIAFDEWNLRGWHHPNAHSVKQGVSKEEYLYPRDKNDDNSCYTMADAVFTACFLNTCNRNCDIVEMANFAPIVNTRGCIFTHEKGIVLRSTYHVFDLFVNVLGGYRR
ncbi:MAG: alpha-L-arabinofuranosidase C-terminal domain-containing protein [Oscillospiraceae bacterium]